MDERIRLVQVASRPVLHNNSYIIRAVSTKVMSFQVETHHVKNFPVGLLNRYVPATIIYTSVKYTVCLLEYK